MELTRVKKDAINDNNNLTQQMEYARLLEKENRFFCVRCISKELSLSCGRTGLDETPKSGARGGSLAAHGKRVYSSCGCRSTYLGFSVGDIFKPHNTRDV